MIASILGTKTRVCNAVCKESFKTDRQCGMNYGLHIVNGVPCLHREEWSLVTQKCAYCGDPVKGEIPENVKAKFGLTGDNLAEAMFS